MAYTKQYSKTTWVNNQAPAINATNLNKIEEGIDNVDSGLVEVEQSLAVRMDALEEQISAEGVTAGYVPTADGRDGWSWEAQSGGGLTEDIKQALLQIAQKVIYIDEHGPDYYDALEEALYPPATLVSISAVYSGGNVYNTATLDDLKTDLIVTAHMSDGTTQTVTTYVLSGTIATGSQTITVTYGGKTTTFTITVVEWLTGISAVYTQSGVVYDTASLNDLKSDLVVTANYVDSTSETVTDYTLSGTLEEGTSTITVAYSGKTATFEVTVSVLQETRTVTVQLTSGYYIEPSDGLEKENASRSADLTYHDCSDAYVVDLRQPYTTYFAFYDENKQRIGGNYGGGNIGLVAVPNGAKYFRTSYQTTSIQTATVTLYTEGSNISSQVGWSEYATGNISNGVITTAGSDNYVTPQIQDIPSGKSFIMYGKKDSTSYRNVRVYWYDDNESYKSFSNNASGVPTVSGVPSGASKYALMAHPDTSNDNDPSRQVAIVFV